MGCVGGWEAAVAGIRGWEAAEAGIPPPPNAVDGVAGKPANGTGVGAAAVGLAAARGGAGEDGVRLSAAGDGPYAGRESPGMRVAASAAAAGGGEFELSSRGGRFWE